MADFKIVEFHGRRLTVKPGATPAQTLVAMKDMVEGMGLDWSYRHRKVMSHPVLSAGVAVTAMQMPGDDQRRGHVLPPLNRVNFWLATLHPNRISDPNVRAAVVAYQSECADALFDRFFGKAVASGEGLDARTAGGVMRGLVAKAIREAVEEHLPKALDLRFAADPCVAAVARKRAGAVPSGTSLAIRRTTRNGRSDGTRNPDRHRRTGRPS